MNKININTQTLLYFYIAKYIKSLLLLFSWLKLYKALLLYSKILIKNIYINAQPSTTEALLLYNILINKYEYK